MAKSPVGKTVAPSTPERNEKQTADFARQACRPWASSYSTPSEIEAQGGSKLCLPARRTTTGRHLTCTSLVRSSEHEPRNTVRPSEGTSKSVRFEIPKQNSNTSPISYETDLTGEGASAVRLSTGSSATACSWPTVLTAATEGSSLAWTRSDSDGTVQDALSVEGIPLEEHEKCTRNVPFRMDDIPKLFSLPRADDKTAGRSAAALAAHHRLTLALNEESIPDQRVTNTILLLLAEPTGYSSTCTKNAFCEFLTDSSSDAAFPSFIDAWRFFGGGVFKPHVTLVDFVTALLALKRCDLLHAWDALGRGNMLHLTHVMPQGLRVVNCMARFVRSLFQRKPDHSRRRASHFPTFVVGKIADDLAHSRASQPAESFHRCWTRRFRGPVATRAQWTNAWIKLPAVGDLVWKLFGNRDGIHVRDAEPFLTVCEQVAAKNTSCERNPPPSIRENPVDAYSRVLDRDWCYPVPSGGVKDRVIAFTRDNDTQTEVEGLCSGEHGEKEFVPREAWVVDGPFIFPRNGGKTATTHRMMMRCFARLQSVAAKLAQKHAHPSVTNLKLREVLLDTLHSFTEEPLLVDLKTDIYTLHARIAAQVAAHRAYVDAQDLYEKEITSMLAEDAPPDRDLLPSAGVLPTKSSTSRVSSNEQNEDAGSYMVALQRDLGEFALEYATGSQLPREGSRFSVATAFTAVPVSTDKSEDVQSLNKRRMDSLFWGHALSPQGKERDFVEDLRLLTAQHECKLDAFIRIHAVCSDLDNQPGEHILYVYDKVKSTLQQLGGTTPTIDAFLQRVEEELEKFKGRTHFMKIIKSMDEAAPGDLIHAQLAFATAARTARSQGAAWFKECMHDAMKAYSRAHVKLSLKDSASQLHTSLELNTKPLFRAKVNLQKLCTRFDEATLVTPSPKWTTARDDASKAVRKMEAVLEERTGGLRYALLMHDKLVGEHDSIGNMSPTSASRGSRGTEQDEDVCAATRSVGEVFKLRSHSVSLVDEDRDGSNVHYVFDAVFKDVEALVREECVPLVHAAAQGEVALLMWLTLPKRSSEVFGSEGIVKLLTCDIFKQANKKTLEIQFFGIQGRHLRCWEAGSIKSVEAATITEVKEHEFDTWQKKSLASFKSAHEGMALYEIINLNKGKLILCELSCGFHKSTQAKADLLHMVKLFPSHGLDIPKDAFATTSNKKLTMVLAEHFPNATKKRFIASLNQDARKVAESIDVLRYIETLTSRTSPHLSSVHDKSRRTSAPTSAPVQKNIPSRRAMTKIAEHADF